MKVFLKKIIISIAFFVCILLVSYFLLSQIEKQLFHDYQTNNSLAIIGNSHPKHAIDDQLLSSNININCKNYGVNGQAMFWSIVGGRKLSHGGIKNIVIEVSNGTYTTNWKATVKRRAIGEIHKKYFLEANEWFELAKTDLSLSLELFSTQTLPRKRVRGDFVKNTRKFVPKLVKENNTINLENKVDFNDDIIHNFIIENPSTSFFIVRAPQHPLYYEKLTKGSETFFLKKFNEFKKHENCVVIDFGHLFKEDELFGDLGHMNYEGAKKFTPILADSLANYLKKK